MWWSLATSILWSGIKTVGSWFTGGNLDSILKTIDKGMSDDVEKERIKGEVTKKWIDAQANLLVGRTWWFQLFFIIPLAVYWAALLWVNAFPGLGWTVHALPSPYNEWAFAIISALYLVDSGKALLGRFK